MEDRRFPRPAPPPPPPGSSLDECVKWLRCGGEILLLFETPSGFALLSYNGIELFRPKAEENIWADFAMISKAEDVVFLKEFQILEDKASAISSSGVCPQLIKMIKRHLRPQQKLAVGKHEHKRIIEACMGIYCLYNGVVMEVMWGLKNLMKSLVPQEKSELTKANCFDMSQGMKKVLGRHGFNVEPEMLNRHIIEMASILYECDCCEDKHTIFLRRGGEHIEKVSEINTQNWDPLKLATALKLISYPEAEVEVMIDDSTKVLSVVEAKRLVSDAPQYKNKLIKSDCLTIYKQVLHARGVRTKALKTLMYYIKEAKVAYLNITR